MNLKKDDIFTAPPVPEAVPPTVERLEELLAATGESFELLFSLGNVHLRSGDYDAAADSFRRALALDGKSPEVSTNLGVVYLAQERYEEALSFLRQAVLLNSSLALPHLHSARAQIHLRQFEAAQTSFERVSKLKPEWSEPFLQLAELAQRRGEEEVALECYRKAFAVDPELRNAKGRLAWEAFARGRDLYQQENHEEAFGIWSLAAREFSPAFVVDQEITSALAQLVSAYVASEDLPARREAYFNSLRENPDDHSGFYGLFLRFVFSIGLIPECYETPARFDSEIQRWQESLRSLGEHPYPHFRIGLIQAYRGDVDKAESSIQNCKDKLPTKKHATLKLDRILSFLSEMKDLEQQARDGAEARNPDWEWEQQGFTNLFERKQWKRSSLAPAQSKIWKDAGFSAAKAKLWAKQQLLPTSAKEWLEAGMSEPMEIKKWIRAGMTPVEAEAWSKAFPGKVEQAIQCRNVGFPTPELAARWLQVLLFPWDAIRWHEAAFTPEDAEEWIAKGISDPHAARERERLLADLLGDDEDAPL